MFNYVLLDVEDGLQGFHQSEFLFDITHFNLNKERVFVEQLLFRSGLGFRLQLLDYFVGGISMVIDEILVRLSSYILVGS